MRRRNNRRWSALLLATLAGGSLFAATCETRIHDSLINGTEAFLVNLLNPSNVVIGG